MKTHTPEKCAGQPCCVHNPSDHPLKDAPLTFRMRGSEFVAERICEHGVGHDDPDHLTYTGGEGIHGCDGCCSPK